MNYPDASWYSEHWATVLPDAPAVREGGREHTWREVHLATLSIVDALLAERVAPRSVVVVALPRSHEMVLVVLALLRLGCVYLPVDVADRSSRTAEIIESSRAEVLIAGPDWEAPEAARRLRRLDVQRLQDAAPVARPPHPALPTDPAYVIHTSGSTGRPKAVVNSRGGLAFALARLEAFGVQRHDTVLHYLPVSFDASLFEIGLALASGACLAVAPAGLLPGRPLGELAQRTAVTVIATTPSILRTLRPDELDQVQVLITGGEPCDANLVDAWGLLRRFYNVYGPTEVSLWTTYEQVHPGRTPTLGTPAEGLVLTVEDASGVVVPDGTFGELVVNGPSVALGYFDEAATARAFRGRPGDRSYRTGDRVARLPDGRYEYGGRIDRQVKIRGFRIEPGEVEAVITSFPEVDQCSVTVDLVAGTPRLTAYVTPSSSLRTTVRFRSHVDTVAAMSDVQYGRERAEDGATSGWRSGRDGAVLPEALLEEWFLGSASRILDEYPKRVLEIGCGSGLLAQHLLPHLEIYVGTDSSAGALAAFERLVSDREAKCEVTLRHLAAHEVSSLSHDAFDLVVLNSVVQYFPDEHYLRYVLESVSRVLRPGGVIYLGDVRDLRTARQQLEHVGRLDPDGSDQAAAAAIAHEQELMLHPAWFAEALAALPERFLAVCRPRQGARQTEMGIHRYDVLLYASEPSRGAPPAAVEVRHVRNARRAPASCHRDLGDDQPWDPDDVGSLVSRDRTAHAVMSAEDVSCLDVLLVPAESPPAHLAWHAQELLSGRQVATEAVELANQPSWQHLQRLLVDAVRTSARTALPHHLRPDVVVGLDALPLTSHGKVDRAGLVRPVGPARSLFDAVGPVESAVAEAWTDVLGNGPDARSSSFDEVGGTSMQLVEFADVLERAGFTVPLSEIAFDPRFERVVELLQRRPPSESRCWLLSPARQPAPAVSTESLVFVHALSGTLTCYDAVIKNLQELNCFGVSAPLGGATAEQSLEELAALHVSALAELPQDGAVHLTGWSLGGALAYEIACQLQQDRPVRVTLIDAPAPLAQDEQHEQRWLRLIGAPGGLPAAADGGSQRLEQARWRAEAFSRYRPRATDLRVDVVVATGRSGAEQADPLFQQGWSMGWGHFANVASYACTGDHLSILNEPHAGRVAAMLLGEGVRAADSLR